MLSTILDSEFYKQGSFLVELTYLMRGSGKEITEHQSMMRGCSPLYMVGRNRVSENKSLTELMRGEGETDRS